MEIRVCVCAASLGGKERSNGRVEKVFLQLNAWTKGVLLFLGTVGRTKEVCSSYVVTVMFAIVGNKR